MRIRVVVFNKTNIQFMNPCPHISQRELAILFQDRGALMNSAATTGSDIVLLGNIWEAIHVS